MKKTLLMAVICLLACASQMSAQLIIRNNGHAEIGTKPNFSDIDTVSMLKIFGDVNDLGSKGRIAFGDSANVAIGEYGTTNTDQLWLHGKNGLYITCSTPNNNAAVVSYFEPASSSQFHFNYDIITPTMLIQSDERFKENVEPVSDVLNALDNLDAVTYNLKNKAVRTNKASMNDGSERYGFLAQNVKEVFPELVHTDKSGYMSVDYIGLIPILVQSIKELRAELAEVKAEKLDETNPMMLTAQQSGLNELEASLGAAKLYQNAPNPWSSETVIRYSLPQSVTSAFIYIYDMQGAQLKSIPATGRGESQVTITARDLKAGMYLYALVADGSLIDSKQMILTK